jgi:hypothetical protein
MIEGVLTTLPGLFAGADLSAAASQYKAVKLSAPNTVVLCAAVTDKPIGILQNKPKLNEPATVAWQGLSQWQCGAVLTAGTVVATNAAGQAQAAVATQFPIGQVINPGSSAAAGDLIEVLINTGNIQAM